MEEQSPHPTEAEINTNDSSEAGTLSGNVEQNDNTDNSEPQENIPNDTDTMEESIEDEQSRTAIYAQQIQEIGALMIITASEEFNGKQLEEIDDPAQKKLKQGTELLLGYSDQKYKMVGENPMQIPINGQNGEIQGITNGDESTLTCTIKMPDGNLITQVLPRKEVAFAYLVAERDVIASQFTDDEQVIFQTYIDILQNGETAVQDLPENLQESITNLSTIYKEKIESLAEKNPRAQEMLNLFRQNRMEEIIIELSNDNPEEANRLKKLIESDNTQLAGLLLLMLIAGTFSIVSSATK